MEKNNKKNVIIILLVIIVLVLIAVLIFEHINKPKEINKNITTPTPEEKQEVEPNESNEPIVVDETNKIVPGAYDENDQLIVSWDELVNTYGLEIDKNYGTCEMGEHGPVCSKKQYDKDSHSGYNVFSKKKLRNTKKLVIDPSVKIIGDYALSTAEFDEDRKFAFTSVIIPEGVTKIGKDAFSNNKITSLVIPDSVISIGTNAFVLNEITSIKFSENLEEIGDYAFSNNKISSLDLPNSLKKVGNYAFVTNKITSLVIPENVTSIGYGAFTDNNLSIISINKKKGSIKESSWCAPKTCEIKWLG